MNCKYGKIYKGTFLKELKNRFLCEVKINEVQERCYVPSSCRLNNFINLTDKEVLLLPTITSKTGIKFSLFAIHYKRNYIILNSNLANNIVKAYIKRRFFSFLGKRHEVLSEYSLHGYKCDFFIKDTKTLIEVKSIITMNEEALFPSIYSKRALDQLKAIKCYLMNGYKACYVIVALNPYVKTIKLDEKMEFYNHFIECSVLGMKTIGFTCCFKENEILIRNKIKVE